MKLRPLKTGNKILLFAIALFAMTMVSCGGGNNNSTTEKTTTKEEASNVEVTAKDSVMSITLPDSTHILLNRGATVSYPAEFKSNERNVNLKGEAYFEVAKSSSKNFNVYAGNTKTVVMGTSFNINAPENGEEVELTVVEGEVEFFDENKKTSVRLKADEQVTLDKKKGEFKQRKINAKKFKGWFMNYKGKVQKLLKELKNLGE